MDGEQGYRARFGEYATLLGKPSQPEAPYSSAYAARDVLLSLVRDLEGALTGGSAPSDRAAHLDLLAQCHVCLGQNLVDTEETQAGEAHLVCALPWLSSRCGHALPAAPAPPFPCSAPLPLPSSALLQCSSVAGAPPPLEDHLTLTCFAMDACAHLALLHSGWDNHARALRVLRLSKALYRACTARLSATAAPLARHAPEELRTALAPALAPALATLASKLTHACFYLTQVYGHLGCAAVAARYVERLLCRQVVAQGEAARARVREGEVAAAQGEADALEWARNALRLGTFHMSRDPPTWGAAHACYCAAGLMLDSLGGGEEGAAGAAGAAEEAPAAAAPPAAAGEASDLLSSPAPQRAEVEAWVAEGSGKAAREALARVRAEAHLHWGQYYQAVLEAAEERDKGAAKKAVGGGAGGGAAAAAAGAATAAAAPAATAATCSSGSPPPAGGPDPFSTLPSIAFGSAGGATGAMRGEGIDALSVDDSDHDVPVDYTILCSARVEQDGGGPGGGGLPGLPAQPAASPPHPQGHASAAPGCCCRCRCRWHWHWHWRCRAPPRPPHPNHHHCQ